MKNLSLSIYLYTNKYQVEPKTYFENLLTLETWSYQYRLTFHTTDPNLPENKLEDGGLNKRPIKNATKEIIL